MACRCAPAFKQLTNQLNALFPYRDHASDGCCGDAAHASRKSDHNPATSGAARGFARAYDVDEDLVRGMGDRQLWEWALLLLGDRRCKYIIYEGYILYPDGRMNVYKGVNAHKQHMHLSIHDWAVHDTTPWVMPGRTYKKEEDNVMQIKIWNEDGKPGKVLILQGINGWVGLAIQSPSDITAIHDRNRDPATGKSMIPEQPQPSGIMKRTTMIGVLPRQAA